MSFSVDWLKRIYSCNVHHNLMVIQSHVAEGHGEVNGMMHDVQNKVQICTLISFTNKHCYSWWHLANAIVLLMSKISNLVVGHTTNQVMQACSCGIQI